MSTYLEQVMEIVKAEISRYELSITSSGKDSINLVRGGDVIMTIRDAKDHVELSYRGKKYTYDKWYTKPEHLATTIINTLKFQEKIGEGS